MKKSDMTDSHQENNFIKLKKSFENYKRLSESIFRICENINTEGGDGRLEILISGLGQLGILHSSLIKLLPHKEGNYDIISTYNISRSILELTNMIHFYSLADIDDKEKDFRIDLYNYLSIQARFNNAKHMDVHFKELKAKGITKEEIRKEKETLISSDCFRELEKQGKFNRENITDSKYLKRNSLQSERKISHEIYNNFYSLYSEFIHSSPLAIDTYKDFFINHERSNDNKYKYAIATLNMSSGFISVLLLEAKKLTKEWSDFLDYEEVETINQFADSLI